MFISLKADKSPNLIFYCIYDKENVCCQPESSGENPIEMFHIFQILRFEDFAIIISLKFIRNQ